MNNFSTNTLVLVLTSIDYKEDDYIHDYCKFKSLANKKSSVYDCSIIEIDNTIAIEKGIYQ